MNRAILRVTWNPDRRVWAVVRGRTVGFESAEKEVAEGEAVSFGKDLRPALVLVENAEGDVMKTIRC